MDPYPPSAGALSQMTAVLDQMSTGSIRLMADQLKSGRLDGSTYGGVYGPTWTILTDTPAEEFLGWFLGWAGFLEQSSALEMAAKAGLKTGLLGGTSLEFFADFIHEGDTPETSVFSAGLYQVVTRYLEGREAGKVVANV
jgi:hypothetical protein